MYRELLHPDDAIVVISNRLLNGDVVLMVHEHCAMLVVYVYVLLLLRLTF
jgi:hypothetical protein